MSNDMSSPKEDGNRTAERISLDIDNLLIRYLTLLDTYTTLRAELSTLQSSYYQSLSRANFSADRGIATYGRDRYASNIQATRLLTISDEEVPATGSEDDGKAVDDEVKEEAGSENTSRDELAPEAEKTTETTTQKSEIAIGKQLRFKITEREADGIKDPLKMFAALPPQSLRTAQREATGWLELVTRLVEVDREMAEVEIGIRRGRKYLIKAQRGAKREVEEMMGKISIGGS